jgi:ATP-dependent exoDNAse (exonuclease V) beta subunit
MQEWKDDGVVRLEVWRERRFAAVIGRELMNGSFDRVVLGMDKNGKLKCADILDYKTDRVESETEREERRIHYQPQLDAYMRAIAKLTGLAPTAVRANLVWINRPKQ